jgi:ATP-binding cassette, subfamily G (WHITE), member 2, PDR
MMSTGTAGVDVVCSMKELVNIDPLSGQTCGAYLKEYLSFAGGRLLNPDATQQCQFCPVANTDTLFATLGIYFEDRWQNFGITMAFTFSNVLIAMGLYWTFRVPKQSWHKRNSIETPTKTE